MAGLRFLGILVAVGCMFGCTVNSDVESTPSGDLELQVWVGSINEFRRNPITDTVVVVPSSAFVSMTDSVSSEVESSGVYEASFDYSALPESSVVIDREVTAPLGPVAICFQILLGEQIISGLPDPNSWACIDTTVEPGDSEIQVKLDVADLNANYTIVKTTDS